MAIKPVILCASFPESTEVDLKLAAKVSGNKKCDLIPMKELLPLTGYIRGGCSPIGMKKPFLPIFTKPACNSPISTSVPGSAGCSSNSIRRI